MKLVENFVQLLTIKRYSYSTIKTYKNALLKFLNYIAPKQPEDINLQEIESYITHQVYRSENFSIIPKTTCGRR